MLQKCFLPACLSISLLAPVPDLVKPSSSNREFLPSRDTPAPESAVLTPEEEAAVQGILNELKNMADELKEHGGASHANHGRGLDRVRIWFGGILTGDSNICVENLGRATLPCGRVRARTTEDAGNGVLHQWSNDPGCRNKVRIDRCHLLHSHPISMSISVAEEWFHTKQTAFYSNAQARVREAELEKDVSCVIIDDFLPDLRDTPTYCMDPADDFISKEEDDEQDEKDRMCDIIEG